MSKSEFSKQLDTVQARVAVFLKALGFRQKGRTHNRGTSGGLVQVVNYQMGEYPIGENYVIPGLREDYYGKFTVNLGVLLPCVNELEQRMPLKQFVNEYDCSIRSRLSAVAFGSDIWFELTPDTATLAGTIVELMDKFGLSFLEQFSDYPAVLGYFDMHGVLPFQNPSRAALELAIVAHHLGDFERAQRLFRQAGSTGHNAFQKHVVSLAARLGYRVT